jgi:hypothetical protein
MTHRSHLMLNPAHRSWILPISLVVAVLTTGLSLPADAWAAQQTRAVSGFQAVALESTATVKVALSEKEAVTVEGEDKALENLETVVESRQGVPTLVVRHKSGAASWMVRKWSAMKADGAVTVTVQGPRFDALSVAGSGDLEARLSNQPGLKLAMAGSGDLKVHNLTAHQVEVSVAGSGDVRVQGAAQNLSVSVAGSGDAWLKDLQAEDVRVSVAGSGDARVTARQRLKVRIAGSGDVRYSGAVTNVTTSIVGSGSARRE